MVLNRESGSGGKVSFHVCLGHERLTRCRRGQSRQYELRCMLYQSLAGASEVWDSDWAPTSHNCKFGHLGLQESPKMAVYAGSARLRLATIE